MSDIPTTIADIAKQKGIDPLTALATAIHESSLNPKAVGDNGTSFGLFQLHEGGELPAGMSQAQAENPATNANIALSEFQAVNQANAGLSPGQLAAKAQRPANPTQYAATVNDIYNGLKTIQTQNHTSSYSATVNRYMSQRYGGLTNGFDIGGNTVVPPDPGQPGTPMSAFQKWFMGLVGAPFAKFLTNLFMPSTWIRVGAGIMGVSLIILGIVFIVKDYGSHEV